MVCVCGIWAVTLTDYTYINFESQMLWRGFGYKEEAVLLTRFHYHDEMKEENVREILLGRF